MVQRALHSCVMENEEINFKRYLVREFFWELAQHEPLPAGFVAVQQESVEVLSYCGYDELRIRVGDALYDVHLSWKKAVPPVVQKLEDDAAA